MLYEPIVLLRYYSFRGAPEIYPHEIRSYNQTMGQDYVDKGKLKEYIQFSYSYKFKNANRKCNCEAEIFFEPPVPSKNPPLFIDTDVNVWQIKHPHNRWHIWNPEKVQWKTTNVSTMQIYSMLVTTNRMRDNICTYYACQIWTETVWMLPNYVKTNQHLLIWKISNRSSYIAAFVILADHS